LDFGDRLGIPSPKGETTVPEISVTAQKYKADLISDKTHTSVAFVDNNSADYEAMNYIVGHKNVTANFCQ